MIAEEQCNKCCFYYGLLCTEGDGICILTNLDVNWDDCCGMFELSPEAVHKERQQREYELV